MNFITSLFYRVGEMIYRIFGKKLTEKTEQKFRLLEPASHPGEKAREYFIQKTSLALKVFAVGLVFVILLHFKAQKEGVIQEDNRIRRQEYYEEEISASFTVNVGGEEVENLEVVVEERKLSEAEVSQMLPEFYAKLEETLLGENTSGENICFPVDLTEKVEGFPFTVTWNISNTRVLDRQGNPGKNLDENGEIVELEAVISYEDYEEIYQIPLLVFSAPQSLSEKLQSMILSENEVTKEEEYFLLPSELEGTRIVWTEEKSNPSGVLFLLTVVSSIGIFWGKEQDLNKKIQERKLQMEEDYPEIISKLTLYIGAGMTVRGAWKKLALDYRREKEKGGEIRYAYEEMLFTVYEWESGIEEMVAYRHFSRRCKVQRYVKLVSMLEQNVRMGAKGLLASLKREAADAFEEKKSNAEKKGEEAGTKLLVPMFLMLLIVMVVIMIPAMMTMG